MAERIAEWINREDKPAIIPAINATGDLWLDFGEGPLAAEAIESIAIAARDYCLFKGTAENVSTGQPAEVERLLCRLTGAEAAAVVTTSAAALRLALHSLAANKEVIVARNEIVETDEGYRLPDVISASGAILHEIGTANCTRQADYAAAAQSSAGALLRVSASHFQITSAAEPTPSLSETVSVARRAGIPLIQVCGGSLISLASFGVENELIISEAIKAGADLAIFRGDKWVGGPPCGLIVGRAALVRQIIASPLGAASRPNKLTLAALAATLRLYEDPLLAEQSLPVLSMVSTPLENLRQRAERLAPQIAAAGIGMATVITGPAAIPSLARHSIPTACIVITPNDCAASDLANALRGGSPPVLTRLSESGNQLLLDLRSVQPRHDLALVAAVESLRGRQQQSPEPPVVVLA